MGGGGEGKQVCQQPFYKAGSFLTHTNHIVLPAVSEVIKSFVSGLGLLEQT